MSGIGVGSRIWLFDQNHRVYPPPSNGQLYASAPIYEKHFVEYSVVGETKASWLVQDARRSVGEPDKVSKKSLIRSTRWGNDRFYTDEGKAADIWLRDNRRRIVGLVEDCTDVATLKQIEALCAQPPSAPETTT